VSEIQISYPPDNNCIGNP